MKKLVNQKYLLILVHYEALFIISFLKFIIFLLMKSDNIII